MQEKYPKMATIKTDFTEVRVRQLVTLYVTGIFLVCVQLNGWLPSSFNLRMAFCSAYKRRYQQIQLIHSYKIQRQKTRTEG